MGPPGTLKQRNGLVRREPLELRIPRLGRRLRGRTACAPGRRASCSGVHAPFCPGSRCGHRKPGVRSSHSSGTHPGAPNTKSAGGNPIPTARELNIQLEDRPGTLGKLCRTLEDRKLNMMAFQASPSERRSLLRLVVDNSAAAKLALDAEGLAYMHVSSSLSRSCFIGAGEFFLSLISGSVY